MKTTSSVPSHRFRVRIYLVGVFVAAAVLIPYESSAAQQQVSLRIGSGPAPSAFAEPKRDRKQPSEKSISSKAVVIGGIFGGAVGGAIGYHQRTSYSCPDRSPQYSCSGLAPRHTLAGTASGAIVGGVAGALFSLWR